MKNIKYAVIALSMIFAPIESWAMEASSLDPSFEYQQMVREQYGDCYFYLMNVKDEEPLTIDTQKDNNITIITSDEKILQVPLSRALKTRFMQSDAYAKRNDQIYKGRRYDTYKYDQEDYQYIDLRELPIYVTYDALDKAFKCLKTEDVIENIGAEEISYVYEIADFFGFPRKTLRALLLHRQQLLGTLSQGDQIEFDLVCNSIRNLFQEDEFTKSKLKNCLQFMEIENFYLLSLYKKQIEDLNGIELVAQAIGDIEDEEKKDITIYSLDISNNLLKNVNIENIFYRFPHLQILFLRNNFIESVVFPKKMKKLSTIFLSDNEIKDLSSFKVGEHGEIHLKNNPLSQEAQLRCLQAMKPSFLEKHRHGIRALTDRSLLKAVLQGAGIGAVLIIPQVIGGMVSAKISGKLSWYDLMQRSYNGKSFLAKLFLANSFTIGLAIGGIYYCVESYDKNLIHKYNPGKVLFDEDVMNEEKED